MTLSDETATKCDKKCYNIGPAPALHISIDEHAMKS